jgi:hypothetical protein
MSSFRVGTQDHAAPVFGGLEIGSGTVRLQRRGHAADQRMVHLAYVSTYLTVSPPSTGKVIPVM